MADVTLDKLNIRTPQNMPDSLDGLVLDVQNGDIGNADTSYFYFDLSKSGFNIFSLQFIITATTLTVEATNDKPEVDDGAAFWTDVTDVVTSGAVASFTATGSLSVLFPFPWSRIRIKRETTNATNFLQLYLTRGRLR